MTLDDIKAAIAAGHKVIGSYAITFASSRGQKREVRVKEDGSLSLHFADSGVLSADHVLYLKDNILRVPCVGEFVVDPLPVSAPKQTKDVYYILKNGCSIEGACREQRKRGTQYSYEEALAVSKELLERYPKLHVTLVQAHSTLVNEIVPKVTPC